MDDDLADLRAALGRVDLREWARGRPCLVRIPDVCNGDPATSVLAHIRRAGAGGIGLKPPDLCATVACSNCHDRLDGRTAWPDWFCSEEGDMDTTILEAVIRFLDAIARGADR